MKEVEASQTPRGDAFLVAPGRLPSPPLSRLLSSAICAFALGSGLDDVPAAGGSVLSGG